MAPGLFAVSETWSFCKISIFSIGFSTIYTIHTLVIPHGNPPWKNRQHVIVLSQRGHLWGEIDVEVTATGRMKISWEIIWENIVSLSLYIYTYVYIYINICIHIYIYTYVYYIYIHTRKRLLMGIHAFFLDWESFCCPVKMIFFVFFHSKKITLSFISPSLVVKPTFSSAKFQPCFCNSLQVTSPCFPYVLKAQTPIKRYRFMPMNLIIIDQNGHVHPFSSMFLLQRNQRRWSKLHAQEVRWSDCWGDAVIGDGVATGELHGALAVAKSWEMLNDDVGR